MWRIQGFVGRVLHRCYGNTPLRLPQNHHVEDEVINTSTVLSTSRQTPDSSSRKEEDGERRKKRRTFQFGHAELPRYTALDAVGWSIPVDAFMKLVIKEFSGEMSSELFLDINLQTDGSPRHMGVAAALFMQICRRIHSQLSSGTEPSPIPGTLTAPFTLHKCGYRILLEILSKRDVLPRRSSVFCLQEVAESQGGGQSSAQSSSSSHTDDTGLHKSSSQNHLTDCSTFDPLQDSSMLGGSLLSAPFPLQNDGNQDGTQTKDANDQGTFSDEEGFAGAALNLKNVGDSSVPVILNIIGLESVKSGNYKDAFMCFATAAQQGYNKALFNTGVCYEKGRGVHKDTEKALHHYWQAAVGGHTQAQYRHAKLLLTSRGHQSLEELKTAIKLLEQSAAAGLTKAQVCLASVYSQEPVRDGSKSVQYLKMAAESRDDTALLLLGQCFENGFGVQQNLRTAIEYYKQAARAGNKQAKSMLAIPSGTDNKEDAVLRSIRSAPCFSSADYRLSSLMSCVAPSASHPVTFPLLPHSWSTGSLCVHPTLSSTPLHLHPCSTEAATCQWTVGIG